MAEKRRVVLWCGQNLLGDILVHILNDFEDVDLVGIWPVEMSALSSLEGEHPDLLVIADDKENDAGISTLTFHVLETYNNLPVFRVKLDRNVLQIYTSQTLPARVAELAEMIRQIPVSRLDVSCGDDRNQGVR